MLLEHHHQDLQVIDLPNLQQPSSKQLSQHPRLANQDNLPLLNQLHRDQQHHDEDLLHPHQEALELILGQKKQHNQRMLILQNLNQSQFRQSE